MDRCQVNGGEAGWTESTRRGANDRREAISFRTACKTEASVSITWQRNEGGERGHADRSSAV